MTAARKDIDAFINGSIERKPGEEEFRPAMRKIADAMIAYGIV